MSKNHRKPNVLPRQRNLVVETQHEDDIQTSAKVSREVPVKRILPENLPLIYSDGLMVQSRDGMFVLSFLQARPELAVTQEELDAIEEVESYCVAQIVLNPRQMESAIKVMSMNVENLKKALRERATSKLSETLNLDAKKSS